MVHIRLAMHKWYIDMTLKYKIILQMIVRSIHIVLVMHEWYLDLAYEYKAILQMTVRDLSST